jgi:hypothetical protein
LRNIRDGRDKTLVLLFLTFRNNQWPSSTPFPFEGVVTRTVEGRRCMAWADAFNFSPGLGGVVLDAFVYMNPKKSLPG